MQKNPFARLAALAVAAVSLSLAPAPATAQELSPEHLELARRVIDLTDKGAIFEVTVVETGIDTMRQIVSQNPDLIDEADTAIQQAMQTYSDRKDDLLDQFARVYAIYFSQEELEQLIAFYESDVGQKLASSTRDINNDLSLVMQVFQNNLQEEFPAMVRANMREIEPNAETEPSSE